MSDSRFARDGIGGISRRSLLLAVPAALAAGRVAAQTAKPMLKARDMNHLVMRVADVQRSLAFYQGLLGMPIQGRQGATVLLRIGAGPQFMALVEAGPNPTGIASLGFGLEDFNVDRVVNVLGAHGVTRAEGTMDGPMTVRLQRRGPDQGGAKDGTPELLMKDPDGLVVQLQDARYCGGAGTLGEVCSTVQPAPGKGLLVVRELNHFTMFVSNAVKSNEFYRGLFGFPIRSFQGPTAPTLAIGKVGFLMYTGGGAPSATPRPASINHVCLNVDNFNVDQITKALEGYGIKPRPNGAPTQAMQWYVSMRMENRGGAKEGTPELYFTDPDNIPIQLQDATYCGGGGYLGNVCPGV